MCLVFTQRKYLLPQPVETVIDIYHGLHASTAPAAFGRLANCRRRSNIKETSVQLCHLSDGIRYLCTRRGYQSAVVVNETDGKSQQNAPMHTSYFILCMFGVYGAFVASYGAKILIKISLRGAEFQFFYLHLSRAKSITRFDDRYAVTTFSS